MAAQDVEGHVLVASPTMCGCQGTRQDIQSKIAEIEIEASIPASETDKFVQLSLGGNEDDIILPGKVIPKRTVIFNRFVQDRYDRSSSIMHGKIVLEHVSRSVTNFISYKWISEKSNASTH